VAFPFQITALEKEHDRSGFNCGGASLDRYLKEQAAQDMRRRFAICYVALTETKRVAGYYTLSSADLSLNDLPEEMARKLPRYPNVPAVLLGRLAVDREFQGQRLGPALLVDAIKRTKRSEIASFGLLVDALDERAKSFYQHHGFVPLPDSPLKLFLPL
jgi:ribosomal protein S18 acetylase RimI-like enzyme